MITGYSNALESDPLDDKRYDQMLTFAVGLISRSRPSARELLTALENAYDSGARMFFAEIVQNLQEDTLLSEDILQHIHNFLSVDTVNEVLGIKNARAEERSSIDELFLRTRLAKDSSALAEAVFFISKLPDYSPFNNMLVYLQNPNASFWATENRWRKDFGRIIKEESRPMAILAPMTPVLMVYDVEDTDGPPLPEFFRKIDSVSGFFDDRILTRTLTNCETHDRISVTFKKLSLTKSGNVSSTPGKPYKCHINVKADLSPASTYYILCHELAHVYLGHLGNDDDQWWPSRLGVPRAIREVEAESVAYIVCTRLGLETRSHDYLTGYLPANLPLDSLSLDQIAKVAGRIEKMGAGLLPPRNPREPKKRGRG